ncbi:4-aminobutyrate aminotransferase-like enzyme [Kribbella orskensis]|uniref:4-aminobutyrate aminotransferase-like enzyme n=1 Tax=Kribbella orskensis TaxID=2512216 RepID=A0ABY2B980_9ACTN|nr:MULTISPECIES: aminotransferase class III-fold pyridoxal phosphate-dependent enzyme [Kribbella]TCN31545.1 4-aminobutyrate aminotransferase-like enzyme [Kribbella sp. VKM Ac-2500]TCO11890.1 4-aminobutyrate aminotransferase-like enzyme [Kribbella orskensis]
MNQTVGQTSSLVEEPPEVDLATAAGFLRAQYGIDAELQALRSERDLNFLAVADDGRQLVLKVSNSGDDPGQIAMESAAMRHVALVDPGLPIPRIVDTVDGEQVVTLKADDGRVHQVRVMTVMPGAVGDLAVLPDRFATDFGEVCARLARALQGFGHPSADRRLDWDPRLVTALRPFAQQLPDANRRAPMEKLLDRFEGLEEATKRLPAFVLHGDVTLSNVLLDADGISGVIDFGDMHHTARVADLAISLTSLLRESADPWPAAAAFLDAYQRVLPLEPEEVELIGELVLARMAASVLMSAWRAPLYPDNYEYLTSLVAGSWHGLDLLAGMDATELADRFHRLCGTSRVESAQRLDPSLSKRRGAALGGQLSPLFYREPLQVVRAAGAWVHTADGRRYLDAYNNVPVVGHAHPAVVQAISRQAAVLNINSRYLHPNAVELAERLTASMPLGLDTCVFVNSGSEANDLAWRMARVVTGRSGVMVADLAYHGVSEATAAWSTNTYPPSARPAHVAVFDAPRLDADGQQPSGVEAGRRVRLAHDELRRAGQDVALLAVDSVFSSAGILTPTGRFMRGLQDETHALGGLFLADEVQAGFGRGGRNLWRFTDFGLTPDFVTLGKPMGNGHPIAALITRREIVEQFIAIDEFFSTFAGNPVSCVAALTVLDVIEQNGLVEQSGRIGAELSAGLADLAPRLHPAARVRGQGLMVGVEVPPEAPLTAADLAERLREQGVFVGTTGPGGTVLKIRPPLIWDQGHVAYFLKAFQAAALT